MTYHCFKTAKRKYRVVDTCLFKIYYFKIAFLTKLFHSNKACLITVETVMTEYSHGERRPVVDIYVIQTPFCHTQHGMELNNDYDITEV